MFPYFLCPSRWDGGFILLYVFTNVFFIVPKPDEGKKCDEPIIPVCGPGQIMKKEKTSDGCSLFICGKLKGALSSFKI